MVVPAPLEHDNDSNSSAQHLPLEKLPVLLTTKPTECRGKISSNNRMPQIQPASHVHPCQSEGTDLGCSESCGQIQVNTYAMTKSSRGKRSPTSDDTSDMPHKVAHLSSSDSVAGRWTCPTLGVGRDSSGGASNKRDVDSCVHKYPSGNEEHPAELLAQARLARWWRREGQPLARLESSGRALPESTNPNTLLFHVAKTSLGRTFLEMELKHLKLKQRVKQGSLTGDFWAAVGSIEDCLGNVEAAASHLGKATMAEPGNKEWHWLLHKVSRQLAMRHRQAELLSSVPPVPTFPASRQVERVSCTNLTFLEFFHKYALRRVPVVITDLASIMTTVPWNLQHVQDMAGDCVAQVKRSVVGSVEWAGLEESRTVKVSEFLQNLSDRNDYLFDWSLPIHCPQLVQELTIPRYFAGDFLQRSSHGSLYQDSWPSLFVAPPGLHSGLHVDAFASNFWMALFQGRKRWVFFRQEDVPCLYPVYANSLDPTFEAKVDTADLVTHPLLSLVQPVECVLDAGEILFVPGGCPHYVENLDTTVAISANFVDLSNWRRVLHELDVNGLVDPRAADLAGQFRQPTFVRRMQSDMGDLPWKAFKAWPPSDVDSYDVTEESVVSV